MPTYLTLLRYSPQGTSSIKELPSQIETIKRAARELGVEIKAVYSLLGQYDAAIIAEAPNDETKAKASILVSSLGGIKTETFRAFTEEEIRKLISELP